MTTYRRSKKLGTVLRSINMTGEMICVDLFERPDRSFGYEQYRRDPESGEGWFPIGFYSNNEFATLDQALAGACKSIAWLEDEL